MRTAGHDLQVVLNSGVIQYDDYGPVYAPVLIFIHGFPFNKNLWQKQMDELKSNYRVISYTIPFSISDVHVEQKQISELVRDLFQLIKVLQIGKAALCGLSLGGLIALEAARKGAGRFTALILVDTYCEAEHGEGTWWQRALEKMEQAKDKFILAHVLKSVIGNRKRSRQKEIFDVNNQIQSSINNILLALEVLSLKDAICGDLDDVSIPVLILVGEYDKKEHQEKARRLSARLSRGQLQIIKFAGHLPNLDNTEEFNFRLSSFINKYARQREL